MQVNDPLNRRRLLQAAGGLGIAGLLAACGSETSGDGGGGSPSAAAPADSSSSAPASSAAPAPSASAPGGSTAAAGTAEAPAAPGGGVHLALDPASEKGALQIFDWEGYEDSAGPFWDAYVKGPYGKSNPLKFSFLENDQQALAKIASGFTTDVTHPCLAY